MRDFTQPCICIGFILDPGCWFFLNGYRKNEIDLGEMQFTSWIIKLGCIYILYSKQV